MDTNEIMARAQEADLNRQRQIEAQKAVINRLLEARESETPDAELIHDLCDERRQLEETNLGLRAKVEQVAYIVQHWDDQSRDRLVDVLAGRGI